MTTHWILGPGAIGRLLAHSLHSRTEITLISRRTLPKQQALITPEGEQRWQCLHILTVDQVVSNTRQPPDVVHITTKAMNAEAALDSLASVISHTTPLVLWQNGFLAQPRLTQAWPGPVLCATTTQGAYVTSDDSMVHAGYGPTFIGDLHNQHRKLSTPLAAQLSNAGFAATAVSDIRQRLWQKLAVNAAINPLVALNGVLNGELRKRTYAQKVASVVTEVAAILQAEGIQPPTGGQGKEAWQALVWQVVEGTASNKASMLQDIEAGRPTERQAILGPLIESAKQHGLTYESLAALDRALAAQEARF